MSMIPMLSMFILTGSSIAFSKLASGAAASSPSETKPLAPEVSNGPSLMMISPPQTMGRNEASHHSNAALKNLQIGSYYQQQATSSKNLKEMYSGKLAANHNAAANDVLSNINAAKDALTGATGTQVSTGKTTELGDSNSIASGNSLLSRISNGVRKFVNGKVKISAGGELFGSGIVASAETGAEGSSVSSNDKTQNLTKEQKLAFLDKVSAAVSSTDSTISSKGIELASQLGLSGSIGDSYARDYSKMVAAEKTYNEATTMANTFGMQRAPNEANVAQMMRDNHVSADDFRKQLLNLNGGRDYEKFSRLIENELSENKYSGMSEDDRKRAAVIFAAFNSGDDEAANLAMTAIGLKNPGVNPESATQNQGIGGGYDKVRETVNTNIAGIVANTDNRYNDGVNQNAALNNNVAVAITPPEQLQASGKEAQKRLRQKGEKDRKALEKKY